MYQKVSQDLTVVNRVVNRSKLFDKHRNSFEDKVYDLNVRKVRFKDGEKSSLSSSQEHPLHPVLFDGLLGHSWVLGFAGWRAEVLHQRDLVTAAKVDELDVLHPGVEVDP